jgi:exonuclease VII small subunit
MEVDKLTTQVTNLGSENFKLENKVKELESDKVKLEKRVKELESDKVKLEKRVKELEKRVKELESDKVKLEKRVKELTTTVATNATYIQTLEAELQRLQQYIDRVHDAYMQAHKERKIHLTKLLQLNAEVMRFEKLITQGEAKIEIEGRYVDSIYDQDPGLQEYQPNDPTKHNQPSRRLCHVKFDAAKDHNVRFGGAIARQAIDQENWERNETAGYKVSKGLEERVVLNVVNNCRSRVENNNKCTFAQKQAALQMIANLGTHTDAAINALTCRGETSIVMSPTTQESFKWPCNENSPSKWVTYDGFTLVCKK